VSGIKVNTTTLSAQSGANYSIAWPASATASVDQGLSNDGSGNLGWSTALADADSRTLVVYSKNVNSTSHAASVITDTTGSRVKIYTVLTGTQYLTPTTSPYTSFVVPRDGTYTVELESENCGAGNRDLRIKVVRGASTYFDRLYNFDLNDLGCVQMPSRMIAPNLQVGDVMTLYMNTNAFLVTNGTYVSDVYTAAPENYFSLAIYLE
jgi:hypothetical protein